MEKERKKQLLEGYRYRKPEMGVLSFRCAATGEAFLCCARDARAEMNSHRFKLSANWHPDGRLQALWNEHGEGGFEVTLLRPLAYEDPQKVPAEALEDLLAQCLAENAGAQRLR